MVICFAEYCDHANKSHHCHHFLFSKEERHRVQRMRTDKVNWITAHNCGKLKWHSFMSSSCWKGGNFGSWHCLTKWALENKLINQTWCSWYNFSQEKLPHTLIPVIASIYCGTYAVPFFLFYGFNLDSVPVLIGLLQSSHCVLWPPSRWSCSSPRSPSAARVATPHRPGRRRLDPLAARPGCGYIQAPSGSPCSWSPGKPCRLAADCAPPDLASPPTKWSEQEYHFKAKV